MLFTFISTLWYNMRICGVIMGWFRNLFKRKKTNTEIISFDANIATLEDTTPIRKYILLNHNEKEIVKRNMADVDASIHCDDFSLGYKNLVKYGEEQVSIANSQQAILLQSLMKYSDIMKVSTDEDRLYTQICNAFLASNECSLIAQTLHNVRTDLELKYIAITRFINSQERHNLLGSGDKDYLKNKNTLKNAKDIILKAIKNIDIISSSIAFDIKRSNTLKSLLEILQTYKYIFRIDDTLSYKVKTKLLRMILDLYKDNKFRYSNLWEPFINEVKTKILDKIASYHYIPQNDEADELIRITAEDIKKNPDFYETFGEALKAGMAIEPILSSIISHSGTSRKNAFEEFAFRNVNETENKIWWYIFHNIPNDLLGELYRILAKYSNIHEQFVFEHRDDYKIYIKEMKAIINEYQNTSTKKWNSNRLKEINNRFKNDIEQYINATKQYLADDIIKQLHNLQNKIAWLYDLETSPSLNDDNFKYYDELLREVETKFGVNCTDAISLSILKEIFIENRMQGNKWGFTSEDIIQSNPRKIFIHYGYNKFKILFSISSTNIFRA